MRTIPANFRTKVEDCYYRVNKIEVAVALATAVCILVVTNFIAPTALTWIAARAAG